ncbi:MAG TPA: alpha-amylase family glycosyl hydrolase [bacterium]|nr:alpha-amylase family glycosyl hydrolase [bacterium]HPS29594.1 alpha-amylase family glycosyl hydrolase [bacterium]
MNKFNIILVAVLLSALSSCVNVEEFEGAQNATNNVVDWRDEVIYQLMTDRFADGDVNNNNKVNKQSLTAWNGGDFQGIIDNIDYLKALGVTTLWISPVVKNVEEDAGIAGYHGYWTQDFIGVNPHFGDMAKLREMVDILHENGIKVILDIVANHIGQLFYYDMNKNDQPDEMVMGSNMTCGVYCGHITGVENEAAGSEICEQEYSSDFTVGGDNSECYNNCVNRCETEDYPQKMGLKRYSEWDPDFDARGIMAFSEAGESGPAPLKWVYMPEINRVPPNPAEFYNDDWYNKLGRIVTWDSNYQVVKGDFPGGLKDLDTTREDVTAALISAYEYWIENVDFDGFRIDTIKHVEHEFWQKFTPAMRAKAKKKGKENFFIFGEAFDGNDEVLGSFTKNNEMDSVFYFSQKFQVYDAIFKHGSPTKNFEDLYNLRKDRYGTVSGVKDADGKILSPQQVLVNFFDNHDLPRFLYEKNNEKALRNALALLLTQDGIPCIYYGTEQNFNGGNDPANREFLATSGYDTKNATFKWISSLTSIRKKYAPLRRGDMSIVWSTDHTGDESDAGILAFERKYKGETILVIINADESKASKTSFDGAVMNTAFAQGTILKDVAPDSGGKTFTVGNDGELDIEIPAQSIKILVKK